MKTLFTLLVFISLCSIAKANIIYVDDSNTSGIENGSLQYPYNTVTEGVNASTVGDTVYIFSGNYHYEETFPIYLKAGITLIGENRDLTVIQDSLELAVTSEPEPVFIHNLTFNRIKVMRYTPSSVPQLPNLIKNCVLNDGAEIRYKGIHQFNIDSCKIGGGIVFAASRDSLNRTKDEYNTIVNCEVDSSLGGAFSGNHKFKVINSDIGNDISFACSIDSIFVGPDILINGNLVEGLVSIIGVRTASEISGNMINEGIGLTISGYGKSQNIFSNEIASGSGTNYGIYLKLASSPATVESNEITPSDENVGIYVKSTDTLIVKENIITGGNAGIIFIGSKSSIIGNTITESDTGMALLSSHLLCNENSISNCSNAGIVTEGLGSFNYNLITNSLVWDEQTKQMYGVPPDEQPDMAQAMEIIHPDDREMVFSEVARITEDRDIEEYSLVYRILTGYGDPRWVDDRSFVRRNSKGQVTHYQGIILDVTDRKAMEQGAA